MTNQPLSTGRQLFNAAFCFVAFLLVQMAVMLACTGICAAVTGQDLKNVTPALYPNLYVGTALLYSFLTVALFVWRRWAPFSRAYMQTRPWAVLAWTALLSLGCFPLLEGLNSLLGVQVPPQTEQFLMTLVSHPMGWITVGVAVPVAEEVVFRGAVLRMLLALCGYRRRWVAIAASALLFGAAHGNLAQMATAVPMGLLLGWLFVRSGSIVPGMVLHIVNNSITVAIVRFMPGMAGMNLTDLFAGDTVRLALFLLCALCVALPSLWQLGRRL